MPRPLEVRMDCFELLLGVLASRPAGTPFWDPMQGMQMPHGMLVLIKACNDLLARWLSQIIR